MPIMVSYGAGTNSTAMLVEMVRRGEHVDVITFADTGGEREETYQYLEMFSAWLVAHGMPEIIRVKKGGKVETLEENCLRMNMLPSVAYGWKSCSLKFKVEPQEKFANNWPPARDVWAAGEKVIKCIGYDAGDLQRAKLDEDKKYRWRYPLIEWDMVVKSASNPFVPSACRYRGKALAFSAPIARFPKSWRCRRS